MNKQTIIDLLNCEYISFIDYIKELTDDEYSFSKNDKWTAGQQLEHIILCTKPLVQIYSLDKLMIEQYFGQANKVGRDYNSLLMEYKVKLKEGGKASEQYIPKNGMLNRKETLIDKLTKLINDFSSKIKAFNEQELDSLLIPHPLFGKLTLREMLYNTIYHVEHHKEQVKQNLKSMNNNLNKSK